MKSLGRETRDDLTPNRMFSLYAYPSPGKRFHGIAFWYEQAREALLAGGGSHGQHPAGLADATTHSAHLTIIQPASGDDPEQVVTVLVTLSTGDVWSGPPAIS